MLFTGSMQQHAAACGSMVNPVRESGFGGITYVMFSPSAIMMATLSACEWHLLFSMWVTDGYRISATTAQQCHTAAVNFDVATEDLIKYTHDRLFGAFFGCAILCFSEKHTRCTSNCFFSMEFGFSGAFATLFFFQLLLHIEIAMYRSL